MAQGARESCDPDLRVPKEEIEDLIVKEEITEELEITFEHNDEDTNDFSIPEQVTNPILHLEDLNEHTRQTVSILVPVKTELTLCDGERSQEEVSDIGHNVSNVFLGDDAGGSNSTTNTTDSTDKSPSPKKSQSKRRRATKESQLHACQICNKQCHFKSVLVTHMRTHTGVKPFACDMCNARFATKHHLVPHIRAHTGEKPFACDQCEAKFTRNNTLKKHMRTHTGEKPFSCEVCQAKFTQKINLIHHMRRHTGEKPYSCYLCQAKFARKNNLNTHMWTHTGDKSDSNDLGTFTQTVTSTGRKGPKVHYCNICHVRINQKYYLIHMRAHAGVKPYSCELCPSTFIQKSNLNTHMKSHTGEKPFSCSFCEKTFTRKYNLTSHMSAHIGD